MSIVTDYQEIPLKTPLDEIPSKVGRVVKGFKSHKTKPLAYRKEQLRNLFYAIYDNTELLYETLQLDLNKSAHESNLSEIAFVLKEILYFINNLDALAKPESGAVDLFMRPATAQVQKHPFGTVLVISPWNYPIMLSVSPVAAALAAGNTVVLKVSELIPNTSRALVMLLQAYLDSDVFVGILGSVPEATLLLSLKFDKILYTGNASVGRIVSKAAATYLTPVILELGGKSPCIVTKHANLRLAARRVIWGKQLNAGQTCVAPDYILVEEPVKAQFLDELRKAYAEFFPGGDKPSPDLSHIVNEHHFTRLKTMLDTTRGTVVVGGHADAASKYMAPTFIDGIDSTDSLMQDEIFGPLIGIMTVQSVDEAIEFIEREHDTPLVLYIFSDDKAEQRHILERTRSGAAGINDPLVHVSLVHVPFGGVGTSGSGAYHGADGFNAFTHRRTVFNQSSVIEPLLAIRYTPHTSGKQKQFAMLGMPKPWFDRKGPVQKSFVQRALDIRVFLVLVILSFILSGWF